MFANPPPKREERSPALTGAACASWVARDDTIPSATTLSRNFASLFNLLVYFTCQSVLDVHNQEIGILPPLGYDASLCRPQTTSRLARDSLRYDQFDFQKLTTTIPTFLSTQRVHR